MDAMRSVQDGLNHPGYSNPDRPGAPEIPGNPEQATRILLELVRTTGRLAEAPAGGRDELAMKIAPAEFNPPAEPAPMVTAAATAPVPPPPVNPSAAVLERKTVSGAAAAEATANASAPSVAAESALVSTLLAVVSELTGYPVEMLGLDMDIEADLGIDSIKRVEILSTLEERSPGLPPIAPEDMGRLKTLGQIIELFSAPAPRAAMPAAEPASPTPEERAAAGACTLKSVQAAAAAARLARRQAVTLAEAPPLAETPIVLPKGRKVFVTDDRTGLSQAITAELGAKGINTVLVSIDILNYKKDMPHAAGLVIVPNPKSTSVAADLKHAFELAKPSRPISWNPRGSKPLFYRDPHGRRVRFRQAAHLEPVAGRAGGACQDRCGMAGALPRSGHRPAGRSPRRGLAVVGALMARGPVEIGLDRCRRHRRSSASLPRRVHRHRPGDLVVISGGARHHGLRPRTGPARPARWCCRRSRSPAEPGGCMSSKRLGDQKALLKTSSPACPPRPPGGTPPQAPHAKRDLPNLEARRRPGPWFTITPSMSGMPTR
jgi:hypothetical protein